MALDKDTAQVLEQMAGGPPLNSLSVAQAREFELGAPPLNSVRIAQVSNRRIPGLADDPDVALRIYQPEGYAGRGALVYLHGGGWVLGDIDSHDETCRRLADGAGVMVVSVDYRLAPEAQYPKPLDDCYAATLWVAANAGELGIDARRIAIGGDSAGGNLAAAVALRSRDEAIGPQLCFQLLIYPVTDADFETTSYKDNADGYFLTRDIMRWFWDHYVPEQADREAAYASPLRAASLSDLPPALVQTAEFDPLRDEGEAYATALTAAGVRVAATRYPGLVHGFFGMQDAVAAARPALLEATAALREALVE